MSPTASILHSTATLQSTSTLRTTDSRRTVQRSITDLTSREHAVLQRMAMGLSNKDISRSMYLSAKTVEAHIGSIFCKLGLYPEDGNRRVLAVLAYLQSADRQSLLDGVRTKPVSS